MLGYCIWLFSYSENKLYWFEIFMSPPGQTGRQRHNVLSLSIHSSATKLLNTNNPFWCQLAQVVQWARA